MYASARTSKATSITLERSSKILKSSSRLPMVHSISTVSGMAQASRRPAIYRFSSDIEEVDRE